MSLFWWLFNDESNLKVTYLYFFIVFAQWINYMFIVYLFMNLFYYSVFFHWHLFIYVFHHIYLFKVEGFRCIIQRDTSLADYPKTMPYFT